MPGSLGVLQLCATLRVCSDGREVGEHILSHVKLEANVSMNAKCVRRGSLKGGGPGESFNTTS